MRLWKYVSTYSNLSGERLHQISSKLKHEQEEEGGVGASHINGIVQCHVDRDGNFPPSSRTIDTQRGYKNVMAYQTVQPIDKGIDTAKFETWKCRRRAEADIHPQLHPLAERPMNNDVTRVTDRNSLGILGVGPSDKRLNERPYCMRQKGFLQRQGFPSGIK